VPVGQLERFDQSVDIVDAVVAKSLEVNAVEHGKGLPQDRPLAPWSANKDVGAFETDRFGPLHLHAKVGQIVLPHPAAIGAMILDYSLGDVTFVDRKSTRLNSSHVKISYAV